MPAMAAGGQDDQPPGRRQAVGRGAQGPGQRLERAGCVISRPGAAGLPNRRSGRFRSSVPDSDRRARCRLWSTARPRPVPAIGTQAGTPRQRTTTPQCSPSGSAEFGPTGGISTQATSAASAGSAAWISSRRGDLGPPAGRDPGRAWSGTRRGRCWPARCWLLQVLESLGPLGLVEALGRGFHQLVEPLELGGQFAEPGSLGGCEPPVLAGGQLVEQAAAQVFLERLPRLGRLTEPGQHGGQGGARRIPGFAGAFQAGEGDPEPGLIQALHRTQPLVACLEILPLGVEVGRQVVVALGGVGWSSVSRRRRISSAFSNSGWASACFPWAARLIARLL